MRKKEILVAVLAIIALFLLYFGFNFLKGVNIFNRTNSYVITTSTTAGLVEQGPVYVRGYKVGQVDKISYDFTREEAFTIRFSINHDIVLPEGTKVALVADGLLGGEAVELIIPTGMYGEAYQSGDTLPSEVMPGMINEVVNGMTAKLSPVLEDVDSLLDVLRASLTEERLTSIMANAEGAVAHVNGVTAYAQRVLPAVVDSVQDVVSNLNAVSANLAEADLAATVARVDSAVEQVNGLVAAANSTDGTIGKLLNDKSLYDDVNKTVVSADSLLSDLKAHPKRYVHFSLFGRKDK